MNKKRIPNKWNCVLKDKKFVKLKKGNKHEYRKLQTSKIQNISHVEIEYLRDM